ncbi:Do family serine endopeptidase [Methylocystis heyeri]|uniref:Probable periplasmic serine endoprotease DegP-like n=1 Tax=Methylocystis heyeri TaxID=391905 RepID=A0A6B8KDR9_9HYPH|nr:Do family serine endopeptidase [Methylocystis heyeri]QGM44573.1 Do family serine endopeptidase [Methylocystis heyeri]
MSNSSFVHLRSDSLEARGAVGRRSLKAGLLGAAALLAFGSVISVAPIGAARAEAPVSQPNAPAIGPASFADLVAKVKGAVVAIKVKSLEAGGGEGGEMPEISPDDPLYYFFKRFGEVPGGHQQKRIMMSQGSGFIISADGYVVTNNHVVEHGSEVEVSLDNGKSLPAKVIGTDKRTDLALLKISDGANLPYTEWSSSAPRVGDWVIAVGNPFGLGGTVTAGIVSARGRDIGAGPYDDFLQIDAPVNRGNSGGPLFDSHGGVIGVNTAIYSPSGGSVGIGFAIPTEVAKDVIVALKEKGAVSRGWMGVQIQPVTPEIAESLGLKSTKGALVAQPAKGGPAESAGLKAGDVVVAVDGERIETPRELSRKIAADGPGKTVAITYIRGGSEKDVKLKLGTLPNEKEARADVEGERGGLFGGLGLEVAPLSQVRPGAGEGLFVTNVDPDGAAAQKGLRRGDVILEANGQAVGDRGDLSAAIDAARKEGRRSVLLRVKSAEGTRFLALPVASS